MSLSTTWLGLGLALISSEVLEDDSRAERKKEILSYLTSFVLLAHEYGQITT